MIDSFQNEYRFLSNFYPCERPLFDRFEISYPTVEHAYQAAKTLDKEQRKVIAAQSRPGLAKFLGKSIKLRDDWNTIRVPSMACFLTQKFANDTVLARKLVATFPHELVEGNTWGDTFWGVCNGKGQNILGKLLEQLRSNLIFEIG